MRRAAVGGGIPLAAVVTAAALAACHGGPKGVAVPASAAADDARVAQLRAFEAASRARRDLEGIPSSEGTMGADPWALAPIGDGFVGVLRGRSAIVWLDAELNERARLPAPRSPSALAVSPRGDVFVASALEPTIAVYRSAPSAPWLERVGTLELDGAMELRDLAWDARESEHPKLLALDAYGSRVIAIEPGAVSAGGRVAHRREDEPTCRRPVGFVVTPHHRIDNCLFDHTIAVRSAGGRRHAFVHDGPFWGLAAAELDAETAIVAAGGVEDHPLDRRGGFFGHVDSFVYVYRGGAMLASINVSELGVITPKALSLTTHEGGALDVTVVGYGSDVAVTLRLPLAAAREGVPARAAQVVERRRLIPGVRVMVPRGGVPARGFAMASPLLDGWVLDRPEAEGGARFVPVADPADARSLDAKLGEALVFTGLMAPWNKSDGAFSRFTCETCHFEGYVDGRVHFTGRADIHATTKPLLGLAGNKPHFSRALDPDLAAVAMNEFRVANAKNGRDPWFAVDRADFPWLSHLGFAGERVPPEALRRAFVAFFMDFVHRPHPALAGRSSFTEVERHGAELFRERCESCHAARLASDEPSTRVPFARWEPAVFSDAAVIVWATSDYAKTGVVPYVNERGTRVPSLRRLYAKQPYFTNGSARDLGAVLERAAWSERGAFFHGAPPPGEAVTRLGAEERRALASFLALL